MNNLAIYILYFIIVLNIAGCAFTTREESLPEEQPEYTPVPELVQLPVPTPVPRQQFILPTEGYLMSGFGFRKDPKTGHKAFHTGIDISNWFPNMEVWASAPGEVSFSGEGSGYGITVRIHHENGFETVYAHLKIAFVSPGEKIQQKETIGIMGDTGRTTGVHLHFEVHHHGKPVDPLIYLGNCNFMH